MANICDRCGCTGFHYNRSRMRMECDSCGHPVYDPQQDQQLMQYDRTYSQAMNHLAVGNWEQTLNLLNPLMNQYPTEKKLYVAVLRAATHDFTDIDMENSGNKAVASGAWDKLIRLNGVNNNMVRYGQKRYEKHREELCMKKNMILRRVFWAAFFAILAGLFFGANDYILGFACVGGVIGGLRAMYRIRPVQIIRQLTSSVPDYRVNPFI